METPDPSCSPQTIGSSGADFLSPFNSTHDVSAPAAIHYRKHSGFSQP